MVRGRTAQRALVVAGLLLGCSKTTHRQPRARSNFTPPAQFLVDKETVLVGIVTIKHVENRWVTSATATTCRFSSPGAEWKRFCKAKAHGQLGGSRQSS